MVDHDSPALMAASTDLLLHQPQDHQDSQHQQQQPATSCSSRSHSNPSSSSNPWGTWEALILACAVQRHGTDNWSLVSDELQSRSTGAFLYTPEACRVEYQAIKRRFGSDDVSNESMVLLFEELRKLRVAQLRRELEQFDNSIGSLQNKIKRLELEKEQTIRNVSDRAPEDEAVPSISGSVSKDDAIDSPSQDENPSTSDQGNVSSRQTPASTTLEESGNDFKLDVLRTFDIAETSECDREQGRASMSEDSATPPSCSEGGGRQGDDFVKGSTAALPKHDVKVKAKRHIADKQSCGKLESQHRGDPLSNSANVLGGSVLESLSRKANVETEGKLIPPVKLANCAKDNSEHVRDSETEEKLVLHKNDPSKRDNGKDNLVQETGTSGKISLNKKYYGERDSMVLTKSVRKPKNGERKLDTGRKFQNDNIPSRETKMVQNGRHYNSGIDSDQRMDSETRNGRGGNSVPKSTPNGNTVFAAQKLESKGHASHSETRPLSIKKKSRISYCSDDDSLLPSSEANAGSKLKPSASKMSGNHHRTDDDLLITSVDKKSGIKVKSSVGKSSKTPHRSDDDPVLKSGDSKLGSKAKSTAIKSNILFHRSDDDPLIPGRETKARMKKSGTSRSTTIASGTDDDLALPTTDTKSSIKMKHLATKITMRSDDDPLLPRYTKSLNEGKVSAVKSTASNQPSEEKRLPSDDLPCSSPPVKQTIDAVDLVPRSNADEAALDTYTSRMSAADFVGSNNVKLSYSRSSKFKFRKSNNSSRIISESAKLSFSESPNADDGKSLDARSSTSNAALRQDTDVEKESRTLSTVKSVEHDPLRKHVSKDGTCNDFKHSKHSGGMVDADVRTEGGGGSVGHKRSRDSLVKNRDISHPVKDEEGAPSVPIPGIKERSELTHTFMKVSDSHSEKSADSDSLSSPRILPFFKRRRSNDVTGNGTRVGASSKDNDDKSLVCKVIGKKGSPKQSLPVESADSTEGRRKDNSSAKESPSGKVKTEVLLSVETNVRKIDEVPNVSSPTRVDIRKSSMSSTENSQHEVWGETTEVVNKKLTRLYKKKGRTGRSKSADHVSNESPKDDEQPDPSPRMLSSVKTESMTSSHEVSESLHGSGRVDDMEAWQQMERLSGDSRFEKSEMGSFVDGNEDASPISKRNRREPKVPGKLIPLLESLRTVCAHKCAHFFKHNHDSQGNRRYQLLIRHPLDLCTIRLRLEEGHYTGSLHFFRDLLLMVNNALVYYRKESPESLAASGLRECILKEMRYVFETEALVKQEGPSFRKRDMKRGGRGTAANQGRRRGLKSPELVEKPREPLLKQSTSNAVDNRSNDGSLKLQGVLSEKKSASNVNQTAKSSDMSKSGNAAVEKAASSPKDNTVVNTGGGSVVPAKVVVSKPGQVSTKAVESSSVSKTKASDVPDPPVKRGVGRPPKHSLGLQKPKESTATPPRKRVKR